MSAEWEDRCRDCDDTGITIQTERRCACQPLSKEPPMTEPEQWAVEWHKVALIAQDHEDPCLNTALGSLYDAFEERERKLREALKAVEEEGLRNHNTRCRPWWNQVRQALKDTTHD